MGPEEVEAPQPRPESYVGLLPGHPRDRADCVSALSRGLGKACSRHLRKPTNSTKRFKTFAFRFSRTVCISSEVFYHQFFGCSVIQRPILQKDSERVDFDNCVFDYTF